MKATTYPTPIDNPTPLLVVVGSDRANKDYLLVYDADGELTALRPGEQVELPFDPAIEVAALEGELIYSVEYFR